MKVIRHLVIFSFFSSTMILSFLQQEDFFSSQMNLMRAMPPKMLRVALGFFSEVGAEILFAHNAAYIGGDKVQLKEGSDAEILRDNFEISARLYPEFVDPYYMSQGVLPRLGYKYAKGTNAILDVGIRAEPTNMVYRFFKGINYFYYMDEPLLASDFFKESSKLPDAPPIFAHLSAVLAAQGGELYAGLTTLQVLARTETDDTVRQRYEDEILVFRDAIRLQEAVNVYIESVGEAPETLEKLIPNFVSELPKDSPFFRFTYKPPKVKLLRPN